MHNKEYARDMREGERFGVLRVMSEAVRPVDSPKYIATTERWWNVQCDCGRIRVAHGSSFFSKMYKWKKCGSVCKLKRTYAAWMKPAGESMKREQWNSTRTNALGRNLSFNLTVEQFHSIASQPCNYCGIEYSKEAGKRFFDENAKYKPNGTYKCNGIDRVDSSKGYEFDNCVSCCWTCNRAKGNMAVEKFEGWIFNIHSHQLSKEINRIIHEKDIVPTGEFRKLLDAPSEPVGLLINGVLV